MVPFLAAAVVVETILLVAVLLNLRHFKDAINRSIEWTKTRMSMEVTSLGDTLREEQTGVETFLTKQIDSVQDEVRRDISAMQYRNGVVAQTVSRFVDGQRQRRQRS